MVECKPVHIIVKLLLCFTGIPKLVIKKPSIGDIRHYIVDLKQQKDQTIDLWNSSSVDTTFSLVSQLRETEVTSLNLHDTSITEQCGLHHLNDTRVKELGLWHCTTEINCVCKLIETNTTLSELKLISKNLTDGELRKVLKSLKVKKSNMSLTLLPVYKSKCASHINYQEIKERLKFYD